MIIKIIIPKRLIFKISKSFSSTKSRLKNLKSFFLMYSITENKTEIKRIKGKYSNVISRIKRKPNKNLLSNG